MILVEPSVKIMEIMRNPGSLQLIEEAGRTCYKSEDAMTAESAVIFTRLRIKEGHDSVIEHSAATVRIICDRGVTHELVRHRICSYSQESTRYCNYAKNDEIELVEPFFFDPYEKNKEINIPDLIHYRANDETSFRGNSHPWQMNSFDVWFLTCLWTQWGYMTLINEFNRLPQQARSVLPNSLKTEIVITANFREWRHIFKLRTAEAAHPQMREIMIPLLADFKSRVPVVFDDIEVQDGEV